MEELYLLEQQPTPEQFQKAIRKSTIDCTFVPVFMGSAFKNKGVLLMSFSLLICVDSSSSGWCLRLLAFS